MANAVRSSCEKIQKSQIKEEDYLEELTVIFDGSNIIREALRLLKGKYQNKSGVAVKALDALRKCMYSIRKEIGVGKLNFIIVLQTHWEKKLLYT